MPTFLKRYPKAKAVYSSVAQNSTSMDMWKRKRKAGNKGREKEGGKERRRWEKEGASISNQLPKFLPQETRKKKLYQTEKNKNDRIRNKEILRLDMGEIT